MFEHVFKRIDDVLWKDAGCTSELDYTEQSSWLLFLKYLDDLEAERAIEADLAGQLSALHGEIDSLRRKVLQLEKRIHELQERESKAA